jgi:plastocyanin
MAMTRIVLVLAALVSIAMPGAASAQATRLNATVGPGLTIFLTDASGANVTRLAPGTYEIVVDDRGDIHNFHLTGPGVDRQTGIDFVGQATWTVTLVDGSYTFQCDAHSYDMTGAFTVGTGPAPPPPPPPPAPLAKAPTLRATVGPTPTISLRTAKGAAVRRLKAGPYRIAVNDRSGFHNFHLTGPRVNRKTTVAFVGTRTWQVRVRKGATYRFVCDAHAATMRGSFKGT